MPRGRARPVNRHWTLWTSSTAFIGQSAGTTAVLVAAAQHDRETIMRTRGNLLCYLDGAGAGGESVFVSVGLILVPEGTGSTVLWSPFTDGDVPWFWLETFQLGYEERVVDVIDIPWASAFRSVIDSKAMRRVRNQEVQMVVENTTAGGAEAINTLAHGRFLTQE